MDCRTTLGVHPPGTAGQAPKVHCSREGFVFQLYFFFTYPMFLGFTVFYSVFRFVLLFSFFFSFFLVAFFFECECRFFQCLRSHGFPMRRFVRLNLHFIIFLTLKRRWLNWCVGPTPYFFYFSYFSYFFTIFLAKMYRPYSGPLVVVESISFLSTVGLLGEKLFCVKNPSKYSAMVFRLQCFGFFFPQFISAFWPSFFCFGIFPRSRAVVTPRRKADIFSVRLPIASWSGGSCRSIIFFFDVNDEIGSSNCIVGGVHTQLYRVITKRYTVS